MKGSVSMNLINNNINRHNNVNFQSVKNVNYKNFKNFPKQGTEMLETFKNNPNVQNFIKNHDVEINMDVNKIKKGYQKGNYLYSFDVRYIDSDAKANQKSGVLNRIKNFFSKSNNADVFSTHHEFAVRKLDKEYFSNKVNRYFDKDSKSKYTWVETKPGVGKDDLGAEGYWSQVGDININDDLKELEQKILKKKESAKSQEKLKQPRTIQENENDNDKLESLNKFIKTVDNLKNNKLVE